jgi:isoleucyl-tRNA synthetase
MNDDGEEIEVIGSIEELSQRSGVTHIPDLHRHYIDKITLPSKKGKGVLKRVEEVKRFISCFLSNVWFF